MKIVLQRVNEASVTVEGRITGAIRHGLLLLVGFGLTDDEAKLRPVADKLVNLRIFPDERGRFHHSLAEVGGAILAVPQFTLFADLSKGGRRPEFFGALEPAKAAPLFDRFVETLKQVGVAQVETGIFGADMKVRLENDGPVTIPLEF
ncbi:MAG: D-tyrosyl-tRNA(Tyr) deacylase [Oligoflexia bacterium]|nr:D-tyrosyl-tRNA(Tyr) deacylase [Oligoflexia bacterium]